LPIYKNNTTIKAFKGDYAPVNIYKGTTKVAGWEFANVSGEGLSVSNTYNSDCSVTVNGKSTQAVTVVGKNKFDGQIANGLWGSAGFTLNSSYRANKNLIEIQPNTAYSLSGFVATNETMCGVYFYDTNKQYISGVSKLSYTTPANCKYVGFSVLHTRYVGVNTQFEIAPSPTTYEAYIPNSPSPEYPSAINSTANFNLVSYVDNLFDQNTILPQNGWVKQSDGSFYVDVCGTVNQKILWSNVGNYTGKLSISYKVKYKYDKTESASRGVILNIVYSDGTTSYWELAPNWATWSKEYEEYKMVTYSKTVSKIIWAYGTGSNSTWVKDIMIKKSETLVPYKVFNGITTNFPYILRSLPDGTKDYIEIDDVTKTARLVRNVGEIILNGSENWGLNGDSGDRYLIDLPLSAQSGYTVIDASCSHYPYKTSVWQTAGTENGFLTAFVSGFAAQRLYIRSIDYKSVAAFKAFLASNPVKVQYKLATPIVTNLNYEAVKQYYPHTNVYSSATVQPLLNGRFRILGN